MSEALSSYKVETAVNILRKFGLRVNESEIKEQLVDPNSFYRVLLRLPAQALNNCLKLQQTEDMQNYVQNRLVTIVFANYSVAMKQGKVDEESSDSLAGQMLAELQNEFERLASSLSQSKDASNKQSREVDVFCKEKLKAWQATTPENKASFIKETNLNINVKMHELLEKYSQYERGLQTVFSIDQKIDVFCTRFPDPMRQREIEMADKYERPQIDPSNQGPTPA